MSIKPWVLLCAVALPLFPQEFRATITGRVTDPTDAAVGGAVIVVKNVDTNESAATNADVRGNYTVPFLRPGNYTVTVEAPGFKKVSREGLTLNVGQTAMVNINLEVGAVAEQVTVTAETPILETAKADRGTVIDNRRVTELPLNARNPFMLSQLVAGVNYNGNAIYQRPFDNGAIADWSINGSRNRQNEFLLDGAPNNAQAGGNNLAYVPPVDSVQEFKIQTNSFDAQYGKTGGGIVNVTLKSGTNELHGTVYEFMRRRWLDANSFQNNARRVERANHYLDQYGGLLSGPVMIPKVWNGRNRTFFMVNYEGYREGTPNPINASVPSPEFLNGDFSKLRTAQGDLIRIYDPETGREVNGQWVRTPFPGNVIPPNRINPIAQRILSFYPKPNTTSPSLDYSRGNLFISPNIATDDFYNFTVKIDQNIGSNHRFFFRHASNDRTETRTTNGIMRAPGEDGPLPLKRVNDAYVVDWVSNFSPTLIFNIRPSFARYIEGSRGDGNRGFDITSLGFPKSLQDQLPISGFFGRYEFSDYLSLGRYFSFNYTNTVALHPTLTWIKGSHSMKYGVDMRWIQYNVQNSGNVFQLTFNRGFTQQQYNRGDQLSGNSIASALLGVPSGGQVSYNVFPSWITAYYAPYFQDDWKVSRRLTLNYGLRWDLNMPVYERYNQMTRGFDASVVNPVNAMIDRARFPNTPELRGAIQFAGVNGLPRRASGIDWNNWQPRIGAAYQTSEKAVLRGGFGVYYLNPSNNWHQSANFSLSTPLVNSLDEGRTPIPNLINNPYPQVLTPPGASTGATSLLGRGLTVFDSRFRVPRSHQFSFGIQYELPWRSVVDVSYVGNRSYGLQSFADESRRQLNVISLENRSRCNLLEGGNPLFCDERVPNPFQGIEPFRGTTSFAAPVLSRTDLLRPYPHFGDIWDVGRNEGRLWYNSMQVTYETRNWRGLNLNVAYTLAKTVERQIFTDVARNMQANTLAANDRPHRLVLSSVYELPFGRNKAIGGGARGWLNRIIGGWQTTAMFIYQSGTPWDLPGGVRYLHEAKLENIDWSAPLVRGVRPCVAKYNDNGTITPQTFSRTAGCGIDISTYNFLILPRYAPRETPDRDGRLRLHTVPQLDCSITKMTQITERVRVQFRAEAFNATNTYMFYRANFSNNPEDSNFGALVKSNVSFNDTNFPRQIQLGLKLIF